MHHVHPETRAEQGKGDQQQQHALVPAALHQEPALGGGGEDQHGDGRHDEDQHPVGEVHVDQQQIGVEDKQERQRRGTQAVVKRRDPGLDGIALGDSRSREGGQSHRRRHIRHDAEVEDEQVHRDQRHDQPVLLPQRHDHRCQQAGDDDVVGSGGQPHAEDQAQQCGEQQHQQQVAHGEELHQIRQHQTNPGLGDRTHDNPRGGGGNADTDHVAGTGNQPFPQIHHAVSDGAVVVLAVLAQPVEQRALGQQDDHQHHGTPEGRQPRREAFHHQAPYQYYHRQQEVQAGEQHGAGVGQLGERLVGIFGRQRFIAGGDLQQGHIGGSQQYRDPRQGVVTQSRFEPAEAIVDRQ